MMLTLSETPDLGIPNELNEPDLTHIRIWPIEGFENHLIYYCVFHDEIQVVRVLHAAQDRTRALREDG